MKLISCIMPTRERPQLAQLALGYYITQTYPNKELIVIDDYDSPSFPSGIDIPSVIYIKNVDRRCIGSKRNQACQLANGSIICHFDSDDWYDPQRITNQVNFLVHGAVTGYGSLPFVDEAQQQCWRYQGPAVFAIGASLMYTKEWWCKHPFRDEQIGEDNFFVRTAIRSNQLISAPDIGMVVARIHADNTSKKKTTNEVYVPMSWAALPDAYRAQFTVPVL